LFIQIFQGTSVDNDLGFNSHFYNYKQVVVWIMHALCENVP
jgi:hypothetical protein